MATILIVDDSASEREVLARLVRAAGHHAEFAMNGDECLIKAKALRPALVLLDVVMPGLDGFGACRRLKKDSATAAIPVVLVTAKTSETDVFWGRKQGADDYLTKPVVAEAVRQAIARFAGAA